MKKILLYKIQINEQEVRVQISSYLAYTSQLSSTTSFRDEPRKLLHTRLELFSQREPTNSRVRGPHSQVRGTHHKSALREIPALVWLCILCGNKRRRDRETEREKEREQP